jgi:hypothetical protein
MERRNFFRWNVLARDVPPVSSGLHRDSAMRKIVQTLEAEALRQDIPDFATGDTVIVKAWSSPGAIAA